MDGRTTALCSSLNGVRKPADDEFWDTYYPPNHFSCRSTVRQSGGGSVTPDKDIEYPDIPKMFQTNLGKQGLIFPPGHAYYTDLPKKYDDCFGTANYERDNLHTGKGAVYESGLAYTPPAKIETAGQKEQAHYNIAEHLDKQKVAKAVANYFNDNTFLTPNLAYNDWRYPFYFNGAPTWGRCPDFKIGNDFWEMKSYRGTYSDTKIANIFRDVANKKQAKNIIVRITDDVNIKSVENKIRGNIKGKGLNNWIDKVIVVDKNMDVIPVPLK
jgi:hypothetical protein